VQINPSRIRKVRDKLEEALEEVESLLEELDASRPPPEPAPRATKVTRRRRPMRRISEWERWPVNGLAVFDLIPPLPQPTIKDGIDVVINLLKHWFKSRSQFQRCWKLFVSNWSHGKGSSMRLGIQRLARAATIAAAIVASSGSLTARPLFASLGEVALKLSSGLSEVEAMRRKITNDKRRSPLPSAQNQSQKSESVGAWSAQRRKIGALTKKKPRCRGWRRYFSTSQKFLGANAGGAGIVVRYFAVLFVHFFLLLAGLTGFLFRLLLLLLSGLTLRDSALASCRLWWAFTPRYSMSVHDR
jgi:hypothetical protein